MYDVEKQPYFSLGVFTMVVMLVLVHLGKRPIIWKLAYSQYFSIFGVT